MRAKTRRKSSSYSILLYILLLSFLLVANVATLGQNDGELEVDVFIDGPDLAQTNTTVEYTIKITGGPAEEEGNWSYLARLENEDGEELPLDDAKVEPNNGTSPQNIFKVNVTTPVSEQIIKLVVNGTSFNETNVSWSGDVFQTIDVFEPILVNISATIRNPSQINIKGVIVSFYVFHEDDTSTFIGNKSLDIDANTTQEVNITWVASKADKGEHEVEIRINENGELLEFDNGDNVIRVTIYVGNRPKREDGPIMIFNHPGLIFIIGMFGFFFLLGGFFMWRSTLRGRGYYGIRSTSAMYFGGFLMVALSFPLFYVSQILSTDADAKGDPMAKLLEGVLIFIFGFLTILLNWDRTRKKRK